jgi:hypothetical protein
MEEAQVQAFKILTIELAVRVGLVPFIFMITGILTLITRTKKQLKLLGLGFKIEVTRLVTLVLPTTLLS